MLGPFGEAPEAEVVLAGGLQKGERKEGEREERTKCVREREERRERGRG